MSDQVGNQNAGFLMTWLTCIYRNYTPNTVLPTHNASLLFLSRYLIFYSPFDLVYKVIKLLPCKMVVSGFKEVQRAHKVYHAVNHTAKLYPQSYLVIILIGTVKGRMFLQNVLLTYMSLIMRESVFEVSEQVRHKLGCKASDG